MNKYLIEILKFQSSVILPGLGALMVASTRTGKVVFNPHLKFNDGSLAKYIAEKEGVNKQEAENQVAKFVREIEAELAKGGKYEIFDFGHFFTNKDGQVDFLMKEDAQSSMAANDAPKKDAPKKVEEKKAEVKTETPKKEEPKKEETKTEDRGAKNTFIPKVEEVKVKAEDLSKVKDTEQKEVKTEIKKTEEELKKAIPVVGASKTDSKQDKNTFIPIKDDAKSAVEPKKEDKPVEVPKTTVSNAKTETSVKKEETKTTIAAADKKTNKPGVKEKPLKKVKEKKEKKKRGILPWIILLLVLGGAGAAGWIYKEEIKHFLFTGVDDEHEAGGEGDHEGNEIANNAQDENGHEEIDSSAVNHDEMNETENETMSEDLHEEEVVEKPVKEEPVVHHTSSVSGAYHIIGNAFGEKSNAENYASAMSSKGYSAQVLGRFDGLYLVAIKSFDSREAANSGLSGVSSDAPSAWVFKYAK